MCCCEDFIQTGNSQCLNERLKLFINTAVLNFKLSEKRYKIT